MIECPQNNYSHSFPEMVLKIQNYGMAQVYDEVWFCGGRSNGYDIDDAKNCYILNMVDATWRILETKRNIPRLRPIVMLEGRKVVVMGGTTSDPNSQTGCRDTREVFDLESPDNEWSVEPFPQNLGCETKERERLWILCKKEPD